MPPLAPRGGRRCYTSAAAKGVDQADTRRDQVGVKAVEPAVE